MTVKAVAIAIVLALVPAFLFAQGGVAEPAKATVNCPEAECHIAPFFRGSGGFVGEINPDVMVDGEPITEVTLVVTCGNVTVKSELAPDADGKVATLFNDDNGLACDNDSGQIEVHGLMDGAWYWIHDDRNSAVEHLLPKDVLMNDMTPPFDASGGDITMTARDYATLVKDTASGRVGILSHILPVPPAEPPPAIPPCGGEADLRNGCLLTGNYAVAIANADGESVVGETIVRGASDIAITASIGGTGNITATPGTPVTADFDISGPGATVVPDAYGETADAMTMENVTWSIPAADAGALGNAADPCATSNQQRGEPIAVAVTLANSANTIPGFEADGPSAMFYVACPATASARGVELVPDNPFPVE